MNLIIDHLYRTEYQLSVRKTCTVSCVFTIGTHTHTHTQYSTHMIFTRSVPSPLKRGASSTLEIRYINFYSQNFSFQIQHTHTHTQVRYPYTGDKFRYAVTQRNGPFHFIFLNNNRLQFTFNESTPCCSYAHMHTKQSRIVYSIHTHTQKHSLTGYILHQTHLRI